MEPYPNRTAANLIQWSLYILREYGRHPAFYRYDGKGFFYVYDSYQIPTDQWRRYLVSSSSKMRRAFFVGLLLKPSDCSELSRAGFDAAYSYFAADGFTEASKSSKWSSISKQCQTLMFIPSIGPGYIDTNIRPWNGETTRLRRNGDYYRQMFSNLPEKTNQAIVSITSFNEWGEGTQIEAAANSDPNKMITYESYHQGPLTYIKLTRELLFSRWLWLFFRFFLLFLNKSFGKFQQILSWYFNQETLLSYVKSLRGIFIEIIQTTVNHSLKIWQSPILSCKKNQFCPKTKVNTNNVIETIWRINIKLNDEASTQMNRSEVFRCIDIMASDFFYFTFRMIEVCFVCKE